MYVIEEIPNNISQDQVFEPNSKGKTRGKGKSYFPFCSFRSLEDTKKCLDREFEGNNWIVKKSDRNLASRYNMIINAIFFKKIEKIFQSSRLDLEKNSVDSSRPSRFPTLTLTQNCAGWSRKVEYQFYVKSDRFFQISFDQN
ncbi:hypothetical protein BpHYR1_041350 [Brachionus plicatilis]|uniref:Uncharacterized protein n=1 Tax=Brachionus plicatilis TaxID=10195 RepID=A0A3M7R9K1_BRAPC|nr:hypothetical protein BpHYR1_041350 [Brachionus plicatilis]